MPTLSQIPGNCRSSAPAGAICPLPSGIRHTPLPLPPPPPLTRNIPTAHTAWPSSPASPPAILAVSDHCRPPAVPHRVPKFLGKANDFLYAVSISHAQFPSFACTQPGRKLTALSDEEATESARDVFGVRGSCNLTINSNVGLPGMHRVQCSHAGNTCVPKSCTCTCKACLQAHTMACACDGGRCLTFACACGCGPSAE